ncbi:hypothetical protein P691DRAFT_786516 [Macrolepiota fuliginosa MF-IS2]|uniref:Uncharacterized protein n=1 Tax=Macrolepiota fuliginosa MF-IS2 TaxID=1400762 RepID=A0A9P5X4Y0_9AGAR|nr:hypothetical protein P691DRAFT_786516 [Macrolepiota fuliginosa MF-IS2]
MYENFEKAWKILTGCIFMCILHPCPPHTGKNKFRKAHRVDPLFIYLSNSYCGFMVTYTVYAKYQRRARQLVAVEAYKDSGSNVHLQDDGAALMLIRGPVHLRQAPRSSLLQSFHVTCRTMQGNKEDGGLPPLASALPTSLTPLIA